MHASPWAVSGGGTQDAAPVVYQYRSCTDGDGESAGCTLCTSDQ